jgi:hypothetical protein
MRLLMKDLVAQAERQGCILERRGTKYFVDNNNGCEAECRDLQEVADTLAEKGFQNPPRPKPAKVNKDLLGFVRLAAHEMSALACGAQWQERADEIATGIIHRQETHDWLLSHAKHQEEKIGNFVYAADCKTLASTFKPDVINV